MRRWRSLALCLLLAACDPSVPVRDAGPDSSQADTVTTTSLDAPAAGASAEARAAVPERPADLDVPIAAIAALPGPAALAETEPAEDRVPPQETEAPSPVPARPARVPSAAEAACVARGGAYSSTPDGGVKACVRRTDDGGRQCRKTSDCQGECLARSRSCAPIDPLLGCNEILQNDGTRVTLCLD